MIALQYIYTSWKNGDSPEKGYMIYSKSDGISDVECDDIKFVMQYMAPKEMVPNPAPEQIADDFPYNFAYFKLSSGRACVGQATYLGKDYSGRFGNYIIYALVLPVNELDIYPVELFGESYIKTFMTDNELNAASPVPALPPLRIPSTGSIINDEQVMEFVYEREEEFAYLLSAVLVAKDKGVPFYLNDTRENLVLWMAALQKMFPLEIAKKITFCTYVGNHEKFRSDECKVKGLNFVCLGVRPDANYFNYIAESNSSRQIVMDFIGGNMTTNIRVLSVAKAMALSYTMGMEDISQFSGFLSNVGFNEFNIELEAAYYFYQLYKEGDYTPDDNSLIPMLQFGHKYCSEAMNSDIAVKIIEKIQAQLWSFNLEETKVLIPYLYSYAGFMIYTVHNILFELLYEHAMENVNRGSLFNLLESIQDKCPDEYKGFLVYFNSAEMIEQAKFYMEGNESSAANLFYANFIINNYQVKNGLKDSLRVISLLRIILNNIAKKQNTPDLIMNILDEAQNSPILLSDIISQYVVDLDTDKAQEFGTGLGQWMDNLEVSANAEIVARLLLNKKSSQFAIYLYSMYVRQSKKPEEAFWNFYNTQKKFCASDENLDISAIILAYLECDKDNKAALKIIEAIDLNPIKNKAAILKLIENIEDLPVKNLNKINYRSLERFNDFVFKNQCGTLAQKTTAVFFARYCQKQIVSLRKSSLQTLLLTFSFSLNTFEKKDYQEFISLYLEVFVKLIETSTDIEVLLHSCYNAKHLNIFHNEYTDIHKKLKKQHEKAGNRLVALTCIYLINSNDEAAIMYEPLFMKYLKKFNEEELEPVKKYVVKEVKRDTAMDFFERIYEKESLKDKLGGFFKRQT